MSWPGNGCSLHLSPTPSLRGRLAGSLQNPGWLPTLPNSGARTRMGTHTHRSCPTLKAKLDILQLPTRTLVHQPQSQMPLVLPFLSHGPSNPRLRTCKNRGLQAECPQSPPKGHGARSWGPRHCSPGGPSKAPSPLQSPSPFPKSHFLPSRQPLTPPLTPRSSAPQQLGQASSLFRPLPGLSCVQLVLTHL